ncbi:retrovirus-related Pol polyprotein from transposon 412 [Trichonephila inaurata madagascariensis]|uniref:RNA-directed DNA polymerase n=1 Tax=Trichonephila inaurata madagascariensis TaxID=2747483 RepID=A0A8X7CJQ5_9ARAC|nr:retrovirus-related Pol polyprotein from transposon 412 [Trichonephila inaurata madagascariensis]
MVKVLSTCKYPGIHCLIAANTIQELNAKLHDILKALQENNLTLAPETNAFLQHKKFNVWDLQFPHKTPYIPDYTTKIHILNTLCSSITFTCTGVYQKQFEELQGTFFTESFIVQTDWTKQFFLNTDGSHIAIAGILMQKQDDGELQPISYYSRTLSATESRYPANKIELLAIHNSVKYFREFLYGRKFTILSDHINFKYHTDLQNPANIFARWLMDLSEYEFEFQYVKGNNNLLVDYISREKLGHADMPPDTIIPALINTQTINALITQELSAEIILVEIILAAQDAEDDIQKIKSSLYKKKNIKTKKSTSVTTHNSVLLLHMGFHQNYLKEDICHKTIIIPHSLKKTALQQAHLPHMGIYKTYFILKERSFGDVMYSDTVNYVISCCRYKRKPHQKQAYRKTPHPNKTE